MELLLSMAILAILCSMMVPSMAGFVKEARWEATVREARMVYTAAQAEVTASWFEGAFVPARIDGGGDGIGARIADRLEGRVPVSCQYQVYLDEGGRWVESVVYESDGCRVDLRADEEAVSVKDG